MKWREIGIGVGLGLVTIIFAQFLNREQTTEFFAIILAVIGGAYIGFASLDGRPRQVIVEVAGVVTFTLCSVIGLWFLPILIPIGYIAHGFWDMAHHSHGIKTKITDWYIPFCLAYDWMVGAYILFWLYIQNPT